MGRNADGSWSAVSFDSNVIPSGGYRRGREEVRSRDYVDASRRRWDALERNLALGTTIGTFGYPFGGYDEEQRMGLEEGWRLLERFQPPSRDYEERLYRAQRQFFAHCVRDDTDLFRELFLKRQHHWITGGLYKYHLSELLQLLEHYWPFGERKGLEFHHGFRLLTEHPHSFSESVCKAAAERMLRSRIQHLGNAGTLAALAERPLKRREILHCLGHLIRFSSPSRSRWPVSDLIKAAYREAQAFGHPDAARLVDRYITHIAHLAGQEAGSIAEVDDIERKLDRKLPYAYREAAADRFWAANPGHVTQRFEGLLARTRREFADERTRIRWRFEELLAMNRVAFRR